MTSVSWVEARRRSEQLGSALLTAPETVPLDLLGGFDADIGLHAVGRVTAQPIRSAAALPTTDVSAMDGWAVAGSPPWHVGEPVRMGSAPGARLSAGSARPVTTGAPIPAGTLAVLRREHGFAAPDDTGAMFLHPAAVSQPARGADMRRRGEEIGESTEIAGTAVRLTPPLIALAAATGVDHAIVRARPRVALLISGEELVTRGVPEPGTVRDALGPILPALVRDAGGELLMRRRVRDDRLATIEALERADRSHELIVVTGGTSGGSTDHVRAAITSLGGDLVLAGVAMRPGHPVVLARLRSGTLVLGLPGNPLAALVCFASIGAVLIGAMLGCAIEPVHPRPDLQPIGAPVADPRRTVIIPIRSVDGVMERCRWHGSSMLRGLSSAQALLVVEPRAAGAPGVGTIPLPWTR